MKKHVHRFLPSRGTIWRCACGAWFDGGNPFTTARCWALTLCVIGVLQLATPPLEAQQGSIWRARADVQVGNAVVTLAPANGARITLFCGNRSSTATIRVGDSTVTATRGAPLAPGATASFTGTAPLSAISESGTATIACSEEVR